MAKTSGEIEKEFIDNLKSSTDKDLTQWLVDLKNSKIEKRNDLIKWLKESHEFGHMNATLLVGIYLNGGNPVYGNESALLENQIGKSEEMRPLFELISKKILNEFPDTTLIPKKTYLSFTAKREFAAINIRTNEIRLGLDLGNQAFVGNLEKSKLTGPMPRISHMIVLKTKEDLNKDVSKWIEASYNRIK